MSAIILGIRAAACYGPNMPGYVGKLLFPRAARDERRRKMTALRWWVVGGVLIVAAIIGVLYAVYLQGQH